MMTQRIFDIENEKDMQDLWDILPDDITRIRDTSEEYSNKKAYNSYDSEKNNDYYITTMLKINWHDKTEITRPIQECTEQDVGKLCYFWGNDENDYAYGILGSIGTENGEKYYNIDNIDDGLYFEHARRLTKQEIEELC